MELLHQAANARHLAGDKTGSAERYLALLAAEPDNTEAWVDFARLLADQEHLEAAEVAARRAVTIDPEAARPRAMLANVLHQQQRYAEAMVEHELAVARMPDYTTYGNRALTRYETGDLQGSIVDFLEALQRAEEPGHIASIGVDLAYPVLASGDLRRGFSLYEERWVRVAKSQVWDLGIPEWEGQPLEGKRVLIHQDQGFGDTFHFCRFAREIAAHAAMVEFAVPATVVRLLQVSWLADQVHDIAKPLPQADFHIPISSVPYRLGVSLDQVTSPVYLRAPPTHDLELPTSLFGRTGTHLKIGIAWAARPTHPWAVRRSIPLDWLIDLQAIPGVALYSLQFGPRHTDVQKLGVAGMIPDLSWMIRDWADTAALIDQLDLVISVDTSVLHLAAAMGKPTIALLGYPQCWRWLRDRDDSPWYHSMTLLRQESPRDWSSAMQRLKAMVTEKAAAHARLASGSSNVLSHHVARNPGHRVSSAASNKTRARKTKNPQKIAIPDVTLVAVDAAAHDLVRLAMEDTLAEIEPARVLLWTDRPDLAHPRAQCFPHPAQPSLKEYNRILWFDVPKEVHTSHFLVIQWDGWVLSSRAWTDEFLNYDYVGALWPWHPDRRVGNGGFSLRSTALANFLFAYANEYPVADQEDEALCRIHRLSLERRGNFKWAPEDLARRFSIEHGNHPPFRTFGFHDARNFSRVLTAEKYQPRVDLASEYVRRKFEGRLYPSFDDRLKATG